MKKVLFIIMVFAVIACTHVQYAQASSEFAAAIKNYRQGNYEASIDLLKGFVQETPDSTAYYLIGYALYKLGKHEEAMEYFRNTYLINPTFTPKQINFNE